MKREKRLDLIHWPQRFENNFYIIGKNNSSLDLSFYNTNWEINPLATTRKMQKLLETNHISGL